MKKKSRNKHLLKKRRAKQEAATNRRRILDLKVGDLFSLNGMIFEKAGGDIEGYAYCYYVNIPLSDDAPDGKWIKTATLIDIYKGIDPREEKFAMKKEDAI